MDSRYLKNVTKNVMYKNSPSVEFERVQIFGIPYFPPLRKYEILNITFFVASDEYNTF